LVITTPLGEDVDFVSFKPAGIVPSPNSRFPFPNNKGQIRSWN
jgi:hypothetical protein